MGEEVESSLTVVDLDAYVEKRLSDPLFVREYIAAHKEEIESLRASLTRVEEERDADGFALEAAAAWLERWAAHVGHCRGGAECTCGLTAIRRDVQTRVLSRPVVSEGKDG